METRAPDQMAIVADRIPHAIRRPPAAAAEAPAVREPATLPERTTALLLAAAIEAGDVGDVRRRVHEVQHRAGVFEADPWRLLAELGELLISRRASQTQAAPAPGPGTVPAGVAPAASEPNTFYSFNWAVVA